ncbi:MAG: LamG domain-containing protein, partial [Acidobacteriota bacterium]
MCKDLHTLSCLPGAAPACEPYDPDAEAHASFYRTPGHPFPADRPIRDQGAPHMGWSFLGRWSHGKMVLLDAHFNNMDFGLEANEKHHRMASLYDGLDYRLGLGRTAGGIGPDPHLPFGWPATTVQFSSPEHFLNGIPEMRPRTPRDVVWLASGGGLTDEVEFDDYLDRGMLIFSPMNALFDAAENMNTGTDEWNFLTIAVHPYYDGNEPVSNYSDMRLQNAATTLKWETPAYGSVVAAAPDKGRIENVALGGIKGRGFFLYDGSRIEYPIPAAQPQALDGRDWVVSLFLDARLAGLPVTFRRLLSFPGGASVNLQGYARLQVCSSASACTLVDLPRWIANSWTHLALHIQPDGGGPGQDKLRFFQDGFLFAEIDLPDGFGLEEAKPPVGPLTIGPRTASSPGVQGWIDEFRVVEGEPNFEVLCNHARGTMRAVPPTYACSGGTDCQPQSVLDQQLTPFTQYAADTSKPHRVDGQLAVHRAIHGDQANLTADSDRYLCHVDYTNRLGVSVHDAGDPNARPKRDALLFREGPLVSGVLRPDSSTNSFCLSCHHPDEAPGLTLAALSLDPMTTMDDDTRRQPLQAPPSLRGVIPADAFGVDKPDQAIQVSGPTEIDRWIHDGPVCHWTFDEGAGTTVANSAVGDPGGASTDGSLDGATFATDPARRTPFLAFDAGLDGSGVDAVNIPNDQLVEGDALSLSVQFRLGGLGLPDSPKAVCRDEPGSFNPCTLIAKAKDGEDWLIRLLNVATTATPASDPADWRVTFSVRSQTGFTSVQHTVGDLDLSAWHHVVGTYDGSTAALYVNPTTDQPDASGSLSGDLRVNANPVKIGASEDIGSPSSIHAFYGLIDDVRVYNRALLGGEV